MYAVFDKSARDNASSCFLNDALLSDFKTICEVHHHVYHTTTLQETIEERARPAAASAGPLREVKLLCKIQGPLSTDILNFGRIYTQMMSKILDCDKQALPCEGPSSSTNILSATFQNGLDFAHASSPMIYVASQT